MLKWPWFRKSQPTDGMDDTAKAMWSRMLRGSNSDEDMGTNFEKIAKEGFARNPYVFRAIDLIAGNSSSVQPVLYQRTKDGPVEVEDANNPAFAMLDLVMEPNPEQEWDDFIYEQVAYQELWGITYIHGTRPTPQAACRELYNLRPDWVKPEKGGRGVPIAYYKYTPGGNAGEGVDYFPANYMGPGTGDIQRLRRFNPLDYYSGLGPGRPAGMSIATNNEGRRWNHSLLKRGSMPAGILTSDARFGPGEQERLEHDWETRYGGSMKAGKVPILGMLKWQNVSLPPSTMQFMDGQKHTALEIAVTFGIPPELLGDTEHKTYANAAEARYFLYVGRIIPTLNRIFRKLNHWIGPQFGEEYYLWYDEDKIPALQFMRFQIWEQVNNSEFISIDEKREAVGYGHLPDDKGDVILVSNSKVPLDQVTGMGTSLDDTL